MGKYISKDALVAEITHKIKVLEAFIKNFDGISDKVEKAKNKIEALGDALLFIENLEVKEVDYTPMDNDFERDAVNFCFDNGLNTTPRIAKTIAKHFFGLGMAVSNKTQKGE